MTGRELKDYFSTMFQMSYYHHYDIATLEDMPVFELDIYKDLIVQAIDEEKKMRELSQGLEGRMA